MKEIVLSKGRGVVLVDDEDFEELSKYPWRLHKGYALRTKYLGICPVTGKKKNTHVSMHRQILGFPEGKLTDHHDLNRLNNQKANLRVCNHSQNNSNKRKFKLNAQSQYKGVYTRGRRFKADLRKDGKTIHLGYFSCEHAAARAFNKGSAIYQGVFSYGNDVKECDCQECIRFLKDCSM